MKFSYTYINTDIIFWWVIIWNSKMVIFYLYHSLFCLYCSVFIYSNISLLYCPSTFEIIITSLVIESVLFGAVNTYLLNKMINVQDSFRCTSKDELFYSWFKETYIKSDADIYINYTRDLCIIEDNEFPVRDNTWSSLGPLVSILGNNLMFMAY